MSEPQDPNPHHPARPTLGAGHQKLPSASSGSEWIGGVLDFHRMEKEQDELFAQEIHRHGGPGAWLNSNAPSLLRLYPSLGAANLAGETRASWVAANERVEQCARCPMTGGACAEHMAALRRGELLDLHLQDDGSVRIVTTRCDRYLVYRERQRVGLTGLPASLVDYALERVLGDPEHRSHQTPGRKELYGFLARAVAPGFAGSLLVTGGDYAVRTKLLAATTRELVRHTRHHILYTWAPRLAVRMREHLDGKGEQNPFDEAERAHVLVMDFVDPRGKPPWADWFLERVDGLLYDRLSSGKPTLLSSPRKLGEMQAMLAQAGSYLVPTVITIDRGFGPVYE